MSNSLSHSAETTVLLIEDNPGDARLIGLLLAEAGATINLAHETRLSSGLARLDQGDIAAILLDLSLPDSHGLETIERVHAHAPQVPVLVLTGLDDEEVTHAAMAQGAQDYLVKGQIESDLLLRSIRYAVDRNRAQLALRESEATWRRMFERNPLPMWAYDAASLRFLAVNKAAIVHYGYSEEEFLAMSMTEILPEEEVSAFLEAAVVETQQTGAWHHYKRDGQLVEVEIVADTLLFAGRQAVLVVAQDITARRRAEEALNAQQAAEAANRAKSEFLSRMSHELRTPLNAILGFAQLLRLDKLTRDQLNSVNQVMRAGRHLLTLIDEVLEISRIEAGKLPLSLEAVRLVEALEECTGLVKPLADERQISLRLDTYGLEDTYVLCDRQRVKQILLNLLTNAVKYNRLGGLVKVSGEITGGDPAATLALTAARAASDGGSAAPQSGSDANASTRVRVVVADTGPGIPPELMGRLFTPFDRLDADQRGVEGTGLGLVLSKRLAQAMNGAVGAHSVVDQGSAFWLELPVTSSPEHALDEETLEPLALAAMPAQARTILYVEDNLSNLSLIDRLLQRWPNLKLLPAMQGSIGLQLAQQHHPDLILLDLHLPDLHGSEVLRRLQEARETSSIPVIVISADATPSQINKILAGGARSYLTKPLDVAQFVQVVGDTLR